MAAVGAIKREMNSCRWTAFAVAYQTLYAYFMSFCIYQFGLLFSTGEAGITTLLAVIFLIVFCFMLFRKPKKYTSGKAVKKK